MLEEGADRRKIERDIDELTRSPVATPSKLSFAGSVYMAIDRPERALGAFLLADERTPDEGRQLLEHALLLRDAGQVKEAREAYSTVEERHSGSMNAAMAGVELGLGLAREGRTEEAIAALRETGARYTQYSAGGEALLEVARLELGALGDPGAAMETVSEILDEPRSRGKRLVEESALLRVEALMAMNRFEDAHASATELLRGRLHEDIEPRVAYARAFSSFLSHERIRALDEFREMVEGDPSGSLVNDALRVMLVIAEAEDELGSGPVDLLADAHSAFLRGDREAGYAALAEIADGYVGSAVATEGLLLLAAFSSADEDYERALVTYSRVLEESRSMTARAEALMRSGDILLRELRRPDDAMDAYSRILEELPENALSGEARRKIDAVRKGRWLEG
jgi:tetratricopeptide (TPR) repeat protein